MKHYLPLAIITLALAACATPRERIVYRDVPTPVPVPCAADIPQPQPYAADKVPLDASLYDLVRALLIDRDERTITEADLRAALKACT